MTTDCRSSLGLADDPDAPVFPVVVPPPYTDWSEHDDTPTA